MHEVVILFHISDKEEKQINVVVGSVRNVRCVINRCVVCRDAQVNGKAQLSTTGNRLKQLYDYGRTQPQALNPKRKGRQIFHITYQLLHIIDLALPQQYLDYVVTKTVPFSEQVKPGFTN